MRTTWTLLTAAAVFLALGVAQAAGRHAAVPPDEAVSTHGPFEAGACDTCHERANARDPGKALRVTNDLCFDCHDDFQSTTAVKLEKSKHPSAKATCTNCHNPHNSRKRKLLL